MVDEAQKAIEESRIEQLKAQIKVVAEARETARVFKERKESAYTDWETQNRALLDDNAFANQQVIDVETKLRELTLKAYAETGNKAPVEGVGIREVTKLDYDVREAYKWALEHSLALKLDTSAFEKIAKSSPLGFVTTFTEPQATIATQLEV